MADVKLDSILYKLRAGSPMPIGTGSFVTHTFMAELSTVNIYLYTNTLPSSEEFRGRGGDLVSANYTQLIDKQQESFSGKEVFSPNYVTEAYLS
jgi:hypothetical protein